MSNTPRTDRYELYYIETGNVSKLFNLARELESELAQSKEANAGLMRACDNLESKLAEAQKQRDHYKAACDQYSEDEMLCKLQEVTKQRDALADALRIIASDGKGQFQWSATKAIKLACEALEATKGGQHE
jgi:hypothetical protein